MKDSIIVSHPTKVSSDDYGVATTTYFVSNIYGCALTAPELREKVLDGEFDTETFDILLFDKVYMDDTLLYDGNDFIVKNVQEMKILNNRIHHYKATIQRKARD